MPSRPDFYFAALGLDENATKDDVTKAYRAMAGNGDHPDHNGDPERWQLITAAYNELKAMFSKKRGQYTNPSDEAWLRAWDDLERPATRPSEPEAAGTDKPKRTKGGYASAHPTGTKSDPSQRCGAETASGPCIRPSSHPHGHMSQAVKDRKAAAQKAKKAAEKEAAAAASA